MPLTNDDKEWMQSRFDAIEKRIQAHLAQFAAKFATKEDLEVIETKLLTAFHQWASPIEMRQRSHAAVLRAIDAEMESVQDRLTKLEG